MKYNEFKNILNVTIFEKSKLDLITKVAKYSNRYIGLFRPTKPKAKILQNLLQSNEIRFGDAFEKIIEKYLIESGYNILQNKMVDINGNKLNIDHFFKKEESYYFVEQKIRDDHDSSKKRGQINNFEKKLNLIIEKFGDDNLIGFFYFIDPNLTKNKNYYDTELLSMQNDYGLKLINCYGKEFFEELKIPQKWDEIIEHLKKWKSELPELPEINFDKNAENTFNEIKDLSPNIYRKLFSNDEIFKQIVKTLFPQDEVLNLLINYFKTKKRKIYRTIVKLIEKQLNKKQNNKLQF
ncbi:MAG: restriction endonuclease [Bacteroidetes bacterium 4572_128]|nr:MAG: restriction endonuclease [Bacteroidetes bacterium 4572_128]